MMETYEAAVECSNCCRQTVLDIQLGETVAEHLEASGVKCEYCECATLEWMRPSFATGGSEANGPINLDQS